MRPPNRPGADAGWRVMFAFEHARPRAAQAARFMKAFALLILILASSCSGPSTKPTVIRIRNASDLDFQAVVVAGTHFGDIKAGGATGYHTFPVALPMASANVLVGTNRLSYAPIDYIGYQPLGPGRFSYVLSIERGKLRIRSEKDT